ncbi:hypothetical protein AHF37_02283, partial [Paragonimus kellicotti]
NLNKYNQTPKACALEIRNSCSTVCECSSDRTANCQRRGLTSVPSDLPSELMELNLAHNELEYLNETSFKHYPNLRKLVLDNNRITHVDPMAFTHLKELSSL